MDDRDNDEEQPFDEGFTVTLAAPIPNNASGRKRGTLKGPIDLHVRRLETTITRN